MMFDNWNPFFDVAKTLEEFDRMFAGGPLGLRSVPRGTFPPINIYSNDDKAVLIAEVPGLKAGDIELTVLGDSVTMKCTRKEQASPKERFYRKERAEGEFSRTVTLPDVVDPDSVAAEYKNGVLIVRMEKAKETKAKKIQIKA